MGNTCIPVVDSCWCMAKPIQYCKVIYLQLKWINLYLKKRKEKKCLFYSDRPRNMISSSLQFSCSVVSNSLQPHQLQHSRLPCSSLTPEVYSNSCPLSQWCHPTISSSVIPFSHRQSSPASESFSMSNFFASGGQSIGVSASASFLPMNIQDLFPLRWTGWLSLQSKGLSRVFFNTVVQRHQLFSTQLSL